MKPFGKTFYLALLLLFVFLFAGEGITRFLVYKGIIPKPTIGSNNPGLNIKLVYLDKIKDQTGKINCIFLGSSMVYNGIDPDAFSQEYYNISGRKVTCFNFGIAYLTGETAGKLAPILINRYQPDLFIFGTSARDYSEELGGNRDLIDDGWIKLKLGNWNLSGFAKENSLFYREYLSLLSYLNPETWKYIQEVLEFTTPNGQYKKIAQIATPIEVWTVINEKQLLEKDFRGYQQVLKQGKRNTQMIIVEIPVNKEYLSTYVNHSIDSYNNLFYFRATAMAEEKGIPFISTVSNNYYIPDDEWADMKHLNVKGAANFSVWLADKIWQLDQAGTISWGEQ
jgi:hypothetical protein